MTPVSPAGPRSAAQHVTIRAVARGRPEVYSSHMPTRVSIARGVDRELLTSADFLERLEPGRHADLIDGEVFMHPPASTRHARLLNFLHPLLCLYAERRELGEVFRETTAVRLSSRNVFLPDLAFYRRARLTLLRSTFIDGAPDLVVEVLSEGTADRDVGPKFAEYEQHGVTEYWILDPASLAHRSYRRSGELLVEYAEAGELVRSEAVPGFFVRRGWLDPDSVPRIAEALEELLAAPGH
jgi:Uma2 family endonuclease